MKNWVKILLMVAGILTIAGLGIFITVWAVNDFEIDKINAYEYTTNTYQIKEEFTDVAIDVEISNISLIKAEEDQVKIVCNESKRTKYNISVANNTLMIETKNSYKWSSFFNFGAWKKEKLELYLPENLYNKLEIKNDMGNVVVNKEIKFKEIKVESSTGNLELYASINKIVVEMDTGNIKINDVNASAIDLKTSTGIHTLTNVTASSNIYLKTDTGPINLTGVRAVNLRINVETGRVKLNDVIASGRLDVTTSTGSVTLTDCDAGEIYIKTSTGTVNGTLLSPKTFYATSEFGRINVPKTTTGGRCEIETETGSIKIEIK